MRKSANNLDVQFFELQPGDGTRYTVFLHTAMPNDQVYVAIGAGDTVTMGYYLTPSKVVLMLRDVLLYDYRPTATALTAHHEAAYWASHQQGEIAHLWTVVVALLAGWLYSTHPCVPCIERGEDDELFRALYDCDRAGALAVMRRHEWWRMAMEPKGAIDEQ